MQSRIVLVLACCLAAGLAIFVGVCCAQNVAIPVEPNNPKAALKADLLLPGGTAKAPALLIAPGEGYHRNMAITQGLAEAAASAGWVSLRFDWRYYTADPDGRPSRDNLSEQAELAAALAYLKKHPRVDPNRIVIAGKSLGSMLAAQEFVVDPSLRALLLLTPICRSAGDAGKNYRGLLVDKRPVVVVVGNSDSTCPLTNLYYWAKDGDPRIAVLTFPGDHGLLIGDAKNPLLGPRHQANIDQAVAAALHWIGEVVKR